MSTIPEILTADISPFPLDHSDTLLDSIADRAYSVLGHCDGRLAKAVALVRNDEVAVVGPHHVLVKSHTDPSVTYHVNGTCPCEDATRVADGRCKHRIAAWLALKLVKPVTEPTVGTVSQLPEARASINAFIDIGGVKAQITLRDDDEAHLLVRFAALVAQFPAAQPEQTPARTPQPAAPVCQWHGPMKESAKAPGTWYCPHKLGDGTYCKTRWPEKA